MTMPMFDVPATEQSPKPKPLCGGKRFRDVPSPAQCWLEAPNLDGLVEPDDQVRAFADVIAMMDVTELENAYRGGGAPAYPPRYVLAIVLFGAMHGLRSGRQLALACQTDTRFMWLAGGERLDHELFSEFRRKFGTQITRLWQDTVLMGLQAGLITLEQVSIDGTKIAAHAKRETLSEEDIVKLLATLESQMEKLQAEAEALDAADEASPDARRAAQIPKELQDAKVRHERLRQAQQVLKQRGWDRVSETEPEAPVQKTRDGKRPGYNGQAGVDKDSGMVVGQFLTDAQNDTQQFVPACKQVMDLAGAKPGVACADAGYGSEEALRYLADHQINGFINLQAPRTKGRYGHEQFTYDAERDLYLCPAGHELLRKRDKAIPNRPPCRVYRASATCCRHCPQRANCITPKSACKELVMVPHSDLVSAMRLRANTAEGKQALTTRSTTVEPTFGVIKCVLGLRQFLLSGQEGAAIEFALACLAINMRKLTQWLTKGGALALLAPQPATAA